MEKEVTHREKKAEIYENITKEKVIREDVISEDVIKNLKILSQMELSREEQEQVKGDLKKMLQYIDQLKMLDTNGAEPFIYGAAFQENVFREDVVTNGDGREDVLHNAPAVREGMFQVPRTVGQEGL